MSELDRYLLRSERCLAEVRRHWAILVPQFAVIGAVAICWLVLLSLSSSELLRLVGLSFFLFSAGWLTWLVVDWNYERFAVTDKRVLLVSGLLTKRLAIMPLSKVTDMTYERSALGRLLGYGTFIMESAGQDQALSRIDYVEYPDKLYLQLTEELFGHDDWGARDSLAPRPPVAPDRRIALRPARAAAGLRTSWEWLWQRSPAARPRRSGPGGRRHSRDQPGPVRSEDRPAGLPTPGPPTPGPPTPGPPSRGDQPDPQPSTEATTRLPPVTPAR